MRSCWPLVLSLSACALSPGQWQDRRDRAVCDIRVDCFGLEADRSSCVASLEAAEEPPCVRIRPSAAWNCLTDLRRQSRDCPASPEDWQVPAVCASVCVDE